MRGSVPHSAYTRRRVIVPVLPGLAGRDKLVSELQVVHTAWLLTTSMVQLSGLTSSNPDL